MKTRLENWCHLLVLLVGIGSAVKAQAQMLTTLHSFSPINGQANRDRAYPYPALTLSGIHRE